MKKLKMIIAALCLVPMYSGSLYAETSKDGSASEETTTLDGMAGKFPIKFRHIIDQLKKSGAALKSGEKLSKPSIKNRLVLYGPTGNGKTTIAKKIAEEGGAHCIYITPCDLKGSGRHVDEGAVKIKETFNGALECADKNKQPVVIIFDGVEEITCNKESVEAFLQSSVNGIELCEQLDRIEDDARVFFIGIINKNEI